MCVVCVAELDYRNNFRSNTRQHKIKNKHIKSELKDNKTCVRHINFNFYCNNVL